MRIEVVPFDLLSSLLANVRSIPVAEAFAAATSRSASRITARVCNRDKFGASGNNFRFRDLFFRTGAALPTPIRAPAPRCGVCAWRRNDTHPRHPVVLRRLCIQYRRCKACLGGASPLSPNAAARQRSQTFREPVADLYVHGAGFRG